MAAQRFDFLVLTIYTQQDKYHKDHRKISLLRSADELKSVSLRHPRTVITWIKMEG